MVETPWKNQTFMPPPVSPIDGYRLAMMSLGGDCGFVVEEEVVVDLILDSDVEFGIHGAGGGGGGDCGNGNGHHRDLDDVNDVPIIDQFDSNDVLGGASSCGSSSGSGSGRGDFGGVKVGEVGLGGVGWGGVEWGE
ncbi:Hypothetical predicted protein [Olea europaea subsp. europaea]|uniref:Uncharacterized protein n=1 Tax=Olea europaea subsp. europaea TaxID=158383 RepID=A0A8S0UL68_OLEEU|nr:Hypothetical predicted protein [Olea europaea subsp. europaea]